MTSLQFSPYVLPLLLSVVVSTALALFAWRRRRSPGVAAFVVLMLAAAVWSGASALVLAGADIPTRTFWYRVEYLGVVAMPASWLAFAAAYAGRERWLARRNLALLAVEPLITVALAWTNESHGLMWSRVGTRTVGPLLLPDVAFGPWYWVNLVYSYALVLLGAVLLAWTHYRSRCFYRGQAGALLVAVAAPTAGNLVHSVGLVPLLDLAPFTFSVSGVALALGLFRFRLLDVIPVARDAVFEGMSDAVIVLDSDGRVVDLNPAARRLTGASATEAIGQPIDRAFAARPDLVQQLCFYPEARSEIALGKGADRRHYDLLISPLRRGRRVAGRLIILRDVTDRKVIEEALRHSEEYFRALIENTHEVISVLSADGTFRYVSPSIYRVLGYTPDQLLGRDAFTFVHPEDRATIDELFDEWVHNPGRSRSGEFRFRHRDGTWRTLEGVGSSLLHNPAVAGIVVNSRDVTERRHAEQLLEYQALHDDLTGLPNRTLLQDRLRQCLLTARRERQPLALLVMDLDRFKDVNDTFGHHYGDLLLGQVGPRLRSAVRSSDVIARLGGDEFAVLLPGASTAGADIVAQKIRQAFEAPFVVDDLNVELGVSVGIAAYPDHGQDAATLLRRADVAMYLAKRARLGQAVYAPELDENSPQRLALLGELRRAIERGQLALEYQPVVDLRTGAVVAVEALARWHHPRHGPVSPQQFVALAEQTGLINDLTHWVIDAALRQCRRWRDAGLDVLVAVNLSMQTLDDPRLPAQIAELLARHGVPATSFGVEITESVLMTNPEQAAENLWRLRDLGVRSAIDDFGTGHSSLAYLDRLPVAELKIDRSFVQRIGVGASNAAIVRSAIGLAHDLGLSVVAEGVEDQTTRDALVAFGCDRAQGHYVCPALPAEQLSDWLARHPPAELNAAAWPS